MKHTEIDGSKVVEEFVVMRPGWEMDELGWITEDGRVWETSHGSGPIEWELEEIIAKLVETQDGVHSLIRAAQAAIRRRDG